MGSAGYTARFTGWVHGRAHANPPIEITGIPLKAPVLTNVRVTGYFPALTPHEVAFEFDELPKGDFEIGSPLVLSIAAPETPAPEATMDDGFIADPVAAAEAARAAVGKPELVAAEEPSPVVTTVDVPEVVTTDSVVNTPDPESPGA